MTSEPLPFDADDLKLMWRVLAGWARDDSKRRVGTGLAQHLNVFKRVTHTELEHRLPRAALPLTLRSTRWIVGNPLPGYASVTVPVASVTVGNLLDDRVEEFAIWVTLLRERADGTIHAEGWRFESPERIKEDSGSAASKHKKKNKKGDEEKSTMPAHPYSHAQAIAGWEKGEQCLIHPPHDDDEGCDGLDESGDANLDSERKRAHDNTFVSHPAFPLLATTLTGMAVAVVATLYGASPARKLIQGDRVLGSVGGAIGNDLELLRVRN